MTEPIIESGTGEKRPISRRDFIKGVIAAGAVATSASYLFRSTGAMLSQSSVQGAVERLITLNVNGQMRRVDVMNQETLAMTLRYKLGLTGTKLGDRKSTRLNSSHSQISYAVFCLKKK